MSSIPVTPIYNANRACTACPLHKDCTAPVPAIGPLDAQIMLVGEAPGAGEDKTGIPFKGRAGQYLDYLLGSIRLPREQVWISNTVKCRPSNNRDPLPSEVDTCANLWLDLEIKTVQPKIIVALGLFAARYLTKDPNLTMEKSHGIPRMVDGRIVLPVYHPASGLHQTRNMRFIQEDFGVLERLINGVSLDQLIPEDQHPNVDYKEVTDVREAVDLLSQPKFALDTETVQADGQAQIWSVQVSDRAGTGYFIPSSIWGQGDSILSLDGIFQIPETSQVLVHNYLYDAQFLTIPNPIDTMVAAYLLQLPMGLKELAYRFCGMIMYSYEEYVLPYRRKKALSYLYRLASYMADVTVPQNPKAKKPKKFKRVVWGWPDPPEIVDIEWDNKVGQLVHKQKNPHNINGKILDRIRKSFTDSDFDPYTAWYDIDQRERALVEKIFGPMPDVDLRDAPYDQAVYYSTRDPDATIRIGEVLLSMLEEAGLMDVFNMEMGHVGHV